MPIWPIHVPVLTSRQFHSELVDFFLTAVDAATRIAGEEPFDFIAADLDHACDQMQILLQNEDQLDVFRAERRRIAAAYHDSPIVIAPDGEHYPSYHDAAYRLAWSFVSVGMDTIMEDSQARERRVLGYKISRETVESGDLLTRVEGWPERFTPIRSEYLANLQSEAAAIMAADDGHENGSAGANSASASKLFSGKVPSNPDLVDLAVKIDAAAGNGEGRNEIARKHTRGDEKKAQSLLSQIRRLEREGRLTLPREQ